MSSKDYSDPRIQKLRDFLYAKKLGVWTVKDILHEVIELYDKYDTQGRPK